MNLLQTAEIISRCCKKTVIQMYVKEPERQTGGNPNLMKSRRNEKQGKQKEGKQCIT